MGGNVIIIANDADWKAKLSEAAAAGKTVRGRAVGTIGRPREPR